MDLLGRGFAVGLAMYLVALCPAVAWGGSFRPGPFLLEEPPTRIRTRLGSATWGEVVEGRWPMPFLDAAREALRTEGGMLLMGRTDPVGPSSLNRALGLQYAVEAARSLAVRLDAELWRFACASVGEDAAGSGVTVHPWSPSPIKDRGPAPLTVLEPAGDLPGSGWLWAFWDPGPERVLWAPRGEGDSRIWELPAWVGTARVPFPGPSGQAALGVSFGSRGGARVAAITGRLRLDPRLEIREQGIDPWSARVAVTVPPGYTDAAVWSSGIPYPVPADSGGEAEVSVALFPQGNLAHLQAIDPLGRAVVGPVFALPEGMGDPPDVLAVLVWTGSGADLDLHAWVGSGHTHPQEPDPRFSTVAAKGTRLIFDGDAVSRASALVARGAGDLSLEVRCYSDLDGEGATAWLYLVEWPGDPLESRYRILGPRRLSEHPFRARWPAISLGGNDFGSKELGKM